MGWKRRKGKRRVGERWKGRERKEKGGGREKEEEEGEEREEKGKERGDIGLVHEQRLDKTKV